MNALTRIGAGGASALLAIGLFAAPPAGAGDDRDSGSEHKTRAARATCLSSDGRTQGRSMSDPDGMSNGGPDKPGCAAGIDADRDGNNGCGNDADREDDNNGHCGMKSQSGANENGESEEPSSATATTGEDSEPVTDTAEVEDDADVDDADADKDDADADKDDAETDDEATSDDGTPDSSTEPPDEPKPIPLNQAGAGFGLLALLGGIVRLLLRIG